jgi:agmatine deiminase
MTAALSTAAADDGFRVPAEWERHDGCWMLWPERTVNWRDRAKLAQADPSKLRAATGTPGS